MPHSLFQDVIIDGEIVGLDEKGRLSFQLLQSFDMGRHSICRYIRVADGLCRCLDDQSVALVEANQSHIKQYVLHHPRLPDIRYKQGRLSQTASSVPLIATMLREQGILCGSV